MPSARESRPQPEIGKSQESSRNNRVNGTNVLYQFDNFRIDESEQRLISKEHVVPVQPKTFEALIALVKLTVERGKDALVTKDELIARIWPDANVEEGNLPDVISNLRAALGDDSQKPKYVVTVPRRGYRFLADITLAERGAHEPDRTQASEYEKKIADLTELTAATTRDLEQRKLANIKRKRAVLIGAVLAALLCIGAFALGRSFGSRTTRSIRRARLSVPLPNISEPSFFAISRDGSEIAFSGTSEEGTRSLYVRSLGADAATRIEGSEGGSQPFWSPDGRKIGFFADDKLKTIDREGGVARVLSRASRPGGGTWNSDNVIVFAPQTTGELFKIQLTGEDQTPRAVTKLQEHETGHLWPSFLPDNEHFLFTTRRRGRGNRNSICVGSVHSMTPKPVLDGADSNAVYVPSNDKPGQMLFMQRESLIAQSFRIGDFQIEESQSRVAPNVGYLEFLSRGEFAASYQGDILFGPSSKHMARLTWYSRSGSQLNEVGEPSYLLQHSISPDGQRVALDRIDPTLGTYDIWIMDLASGREKKITSDRLDDYSAFWSPDGSELIYACYASTIASRTNYANLCERPADGSGSERVLSPAVETQIPTDWSANGKYIAFYTRDAKANPGDPQRVIRILELGGRITTPFPSCDCDEWQAVFAPNVKWIAFTSDASGRKELYIRPFPFRDGVTIPVSNEGGSLPHWNPDGKELFYVSADQNLMAVKFDEKSHAVGHPAKLFHAAFERPGTVVYSYAVGSDANRFLVRSTITEQSSSSVTVLLNWLTE